MCVLGLVVAGGVEDCATRFGSGGFGWRLRHGAEKLRSGLAKFTSRHSALIGSGAE
jgi:hypothetical protein